MDEKLRELRELIRKWRKSCRHTYVDPNSHAEDAAAEADDVATLRCADELEQVLERAQPALSNEEKLQVECLKIGLAAVQPSVAAQGTDGLRGTMCCPICGSADPHAHTQEEIYDGLKSLAARFGHNVFVSKSLLCTLGSEEPCFHSEVIKLGMELAGKVADVQSLHRLAATIGNYLASHDAALKASVREEVLHEAIRHYGDTEEEFLHWLIETHEAARLALTHTEKASQPMNELETRGTMECPICGVAAMHPHSRQEIVSWLKAQGTRLGVDVVDAQIPFGVRVEEIAKSIGERIVLHFFGNRPQLSDQQVIMARNQMKECQPLIAKILNDCHILAIAQQTDRRETAMSQCEHGSFCKDASCRCECHVSEQNMTDPTREREDSTLVCPVCYGNHSHCSRGCQMCDDPNSPHPRYASIYCEGCKLSLCVGCYERHKPNCGRFA